MYKNILIATDGSELASKGVSQGLALAEKFGAKVTFLSVVEPLAQVAIQAAIAGGIEDPVGGYDRQIDESMKKRYMRPSNKKPHSTASPLICCMRLTNLRQRPSSGSPK
jgi:nucleotide-binding universal stress UspA family protein